jgi:D-3-phosphoglycerate dehydrogenase / 2-oxoglutarate reductase
MTFKVALVGMDGKAVPDWVYTDLQQAEIDFAFKQCKTREELAAVGGDADVIWVFGSHESVYKENLDVLKRCGAIIRTGSGTDNIPVAEATELGIIVANTPEAAGDTVADHAIGLLFAVTRQIVAQDRLVHAGKWGRDLAWPNYHLRGQTLGLVGFGLIARLVARKLSGFDMRMVSHDPVVAPGIMAAAGVQATDFDGLLKQSDYISVHCPLLPTTHHLINERALRLMKPTAVLINTSRGPVIDESALIRALTEKWISAAGLDVFEQEPIAPENPLLKFENVVVTPHIAGYSDVFWHNFWKHSVDTAIDLSQGRWPRSYVNRDVRPRWSHLQKPMAQRS